MKKNMNSKHICSMVVYTLLSLFLCMAGVGNASAAEQLNPVVKIDNASYTSGGTEVTLRLWMFNWKSSNFGSTEDYKARFTGDVYLYIDNKEVVKLNDMWRYISDSGYSSLNPQNGTVSRIWNMYLDGTYVGTAKFQDLKVGQTCPDNSNTTEKTWSTIDLKLSFKNLFSYYGHKITVKGKWQDQGSGSLVENDVVLDNDINGFVRPINLRVDLSGDNMVFSWNQQGYNSSASTDGKWVVYKREGNNNVKLGEVAANEHSLSIEKKQYDPYSSDYNVTFLPSVCKLEETICGLTTTIADNVRFFSYQTSDGKKVDISKKDFGAKVLEHWRVGDGNCVIEFDAPITKIPVKAFYNCKNLTGNLFIPNSVTEIGDNAFSGCSGFNGKLTISNSVTTIGDRAFAYCSKFTGDLTIPNSVETIGGSAFEGCDGFKGKLTISNSVTTIEESTFYGCSGFTGDLTIPNSVKTIGKSAFYGCIGFTGDLSLPKSLEVVGYRPFEYCRRIQTINFQSLPKGISEDLGVQKKTVSLSDDSYISDKASGTVNAISYTRTMSSNWDTLVLPYSLTLTGNEPYRLYAIDNMTGEELVLKQLDGEVAAGTPCVVKRNGTESELKFDANDAALNMAIDGKTVGGMTFCGTYWTKDVNSGYVISENSFWNVEELKNSSSVNAVKVNPFCAWLDGTSANAPAQLSMRIDGSSTGIDAIDALNDAEAEYYDLSGKRLNEPQRGVNIVRMKSGKTKKIIIK